MRQHGLEGAVSTRSTATCPLHTLTHTHTHTHTRGAHLLYPSPLLGTPLPLGRQALADTYALLAPVRDCLVAQLHQPLATDVGELGRDGGHVAGG